MVRVEQIKLVLQDLICIPESCLSFRNTFTTWLRRRLRLERPAVVSRPREIILKLAQIEAAEKAALTDFAITSREIADGAAAFSSMFSAARGGKLINLSDAECATSEVIDSIVQNGLGAWLDDVRRYRHRIRVTAGNLRH